MRTTALPPLAAALTLAAVLSAAAHCDDGPIGDFRRVIVNGTDLPVVIELGSSTFSDDVTIAIALGDSTVDEGTCYFEHASPRYCDFVSNVPNAIVFADSLRLEQDFVSNIVDARWVGAPIPVGVPEGEMRHGYTALPGGDLRTFRYVVGAEDVGAAEPF